LTGRSGGQVERKGFKTVREGCRIKVRGVGTVQVGEVSAQEILRQIMIGDGKAAIEPSCIKNRHCYVCEKDSEQGNKRGVSHKKEALGVKDRRKEKKDYLWESTGIRYALTCHEGAGG